MEGDGEREEMRSTVVACNEDKVNTLYFWGEDELPIADRYTYVRWRRDIRILLLGYTRSKSNRKG